MQATRSQTWQRYRHVPPEIACPLIDLLLLVVAEAADLTDCRTIALPYGTEQDANPSERLPGFKTGGTWITASCPDGCCARRGPHEVGRGAILRASSRSRRRGSPPQHAIVIVVAARSPPPRGGVGGAHPAVQAAEECAVAQSTRGRPWSTPPSPTVTHKLDDAARIACMTAMLEPPWSR